jgi:hypothetical protein
MCQLGTAARAVTVTVSERQQSAECSDSAAQFALAMEPVAFHQVCEFAVLHHLN